MTTLEIVAGSFLIFSSLIITIAVALQSSKGDGLTSAIMGTGGMGGGRERAKSADAKLSTLTKYLTILFFIVTIAVNIIALVVI